jgi:hypothetical protein
MVESMGEINTEKQYKHLVNNDKKKCAHKTCIMHKKWGIQTTKRNLVDDNNCGFFYNIEQCPILAGKEIKPIDDFETEQFKDLQSRLGTKELYERSFPEDFDMGVNNMRVIRCTDCGKEFVGHKRRVTCKRCLKELE